MTKDIVRKLTNVLNAGLISEVQVVYLLVGVSKMIERERIDNQYAALNFYCDWALRAGIDGLPADTLLRRFDAARGLLTGHIERSALPSGLRDEIDRISQMDVVQE
jgi:hypothetical protein